MAEQRRDLDVPRRLVAAHAIEVGARATVSMIIENDLPGWWSASSIAARAAEAALPPMAGSAANRD